MVIALFVVNVTDTRKLLRIGDEIDKKELNKESWALITSKNYPDSLFIKKLDSILQEKNFYTLEKKKEKEKSFFSMFLGKDKSWEV